MDVQTLGLILFEVVVCFAEFPDGFELVGFDVALKHLNAAMAGDFADVVDIHSAEVHQGGAGAACSVGVDELPFAYPGLRGDSPFGGGYLDPLIQPGHTANGFDCSVDLLLGEVRQRRRVFVQYCP